MDIYLSLIIIVVQYLLYILAIVAFIFWIVFKFSNVLKTLFAKYLSNEEPTKIVQVKALKFYAVLRAIIMISTFLVIGYITVYKPGYSEKNIWVFSSALLFLCISMFYTYLVIVGPLFKDGEKHRARIKYKTAVNDYRKDMNIVFTLFFLTTFMITIVSYLLPAEIDKEIIVLSKWLTVPLFSSGIIYLIGAEKKLEDIYCIYYQDEYYKSDVVKLL